MKKVGNRKYDFAGWVTKNDILCADGVTIKHDAFRDNDGQKVPLVWNHEYSNPDNVLGYVQLENKETGVYGYGFFNDTQQGQNAKELVKHGDVTSMSIGARKIKRSGNDVVHGLIYEVSLVLASANPGATIETVITHSDNGDLEEGYIFTGNLIHSADDLPPEDKPKDEPKEETKDESKEETIGEILEGLNPKQKDAVYSLLGLVADSQVADEETNESDVNKDNEKGDEDVMKQNVFNKDKSSKPEEILKHSFNEILKQAAASKSSLNDMLAASDDETLKHGINSIEMLFPEAYASTNGNTPILYRDPNTEFELILNKVHKTPFSRIKTLVADITEDEARAKGYIKGNMKKEEFFSLIKRLTQPTTIYKKQKLDRDDMLDITDFDVVMFMKSEMQLMLKEEIARALLVGDGRAIDDEDKINEENIRPIIKDHDFFVIRKTFEGASVFVETVIKSMKEYRGSGRPDLFIDPDLLADVKLLKATDGRFLFGDIPSDAAIATRLGVNSIVPTTFMIGKGALIVNLKDYSLGAVKGGQITNFDDFDIDFNQYKYLSETRLCGALTMPKSAIHLSTTASTGATDTKAGLTYGKRQADKTPEAGPTD